MNKEGLIKYNSFAVVLLIFIYSITTIFSLFVNQGYLIIGLTLVGIVPMIILNFIFKLRPNTIYAFFFILLVLLLLIIEYVFYSQFHEAIRTTIINFLSIGILGLLVGCSQVDIKYCEKYLKTFAFLGFILSVAYLVLIRGSFAYSMRFGYALLPSAMAFLMFYLKESKLYYLGLFAISVLLLMAWGSRGSLLAILLYFFIYLLRSKNWLLLVLSLFLIILLWGFLMEIMEKIVLFVSDITGAKKIESILKVVSGEVDLMDSSSGRDVLYQRAFELFLQKPFGNGVGYWAYDPYMNGLYPHNIFLQVSTELGIFGLLVFVVIVIVTVIRLIRLEGDLFMFWALLFSITYGRLLVSSTFWERPEFWLFNGALLFGSMTYSDKTRNA